MSVSGADLRAARIAAGLSQRAVADASGLSQTHLSRVESGEREVTPSTLQAYRQACGIDIAASPRIENAASPAGPVSLTVDDVRRRNILGLVAAASVGAAATEPLTHLLEAAPAAELPTRVGVPEVAAVEQIADFATAQDLQYGGGLAADIARGPLRWATGLLGRTMSAGTADRLRAAVGSLADRVGWSYYDIGRHQAATDLFTLALDTAAPGADRNLRAHILLNLSTLSFDVGHGPDAVEILRLGLGDERISAAERANLHAVCARHCGGLGERQAGLRHLGLAQEALARADHGEAAQWARRVTAEPGHFDSALGLAAFALGEQQEAISRFTAAIDALGPGRHRTVLRCRTRLAVLYLGAGATSDGEAQARQALADAATVRSTRVLEDLRLVEGSARSHGLTGLADEVAATVASGHA